MPKWRIIVHFSFGTLVQIQKLNISFLILGYSFTLNAHPSHQFKSVNNLLSLLVNALVEQFMRRLLLNISLPAPHVCKTSVQIIHAHPQTKRSDIKQKLCYLLCNDSSNKIKEKSMSNGGVYDTNKINDYIIFFFLANFMLSSLMTRKFSPINQLLFDDIQKCMCVYVYGCVYSSSPFYFFSFASLLFIASQIVCILFRMILILIDVANNAAPYVKWLNRK